MSLKGKNMNKQLLLSVALGGALTVAGAPTTEVVDGRSVFTVPEGETYTMTAEEGAALPANAFKVSDAVKAGRWRLVKEGDTLSFASALGLTVILR